MAGYFQPLVTSEATCAFPRRTSSTPSCMPNQAREEKLREGLFPLEWTQRRRAGGTGGQIPIGIPSRFSNVRTWRAGPYLPTLGTRRFPQHIHDIRCGETSCWGNGRIPKDGSQILKYSGIRAPFPITTIFHT